MKDILKEDLCRLGIIKGMIIMVYFLLFLLGWVNGGLVVVV